MKMNFFWMLHSVIWKKLNVSKAFTASETSVNFSHRLRGATFQMTVIFKQNKFCPNDRNARNSHISVLSQTVSRRQIYWECIVTLQLQHQNSGTQVSAFFLKFLTDASDMCPSCTRFEAADIFLCFSSCFHQVRY